MPWPKQLRPRIMTRHEATTTKSARSVAVPSTIPAQTNRRYCPVCTGQLGKQSEPAVIYRRSNHSVTFRCQACYLQWTITWASLHRAPRLLRLPSVRLAFLLMTVGSSNAISSRTGQSLRSGEKQRANRPSPGKRTGARFVCQIGLDPTEAKRLRGVPRRCARGWVEALIRRTIRAQSRASGGSLFLLDASGALCRLCRSLPWPHSITQRCKRAVSGFRESDINS